MDDYIKVSKAMACEKEALTGRPYDTGNSQYEAGWDDACNYIKDYIGIQHPDVVEHSGCWIPCSEMLPKYTGKFLCYCNGEVRILKYHRRQQEFRYGDRKRNVTHWQPLPNPPEGGGTP